MQYFTVPATVNAAGAFNVYPMPSATINAGDFIIGFSAPITPGINPAEVDVDSGSQQRSYVSTNSGATYSLLDTLGTPGNFAIRATISVPGTGNPGGDSS